MVRSHLWRWATRRDALFRQERRLSDVVVLHDNLIVLGPWIGNCQFFFQKFKDVSRIAEPVGSVRGAALRRKKPYGNILVLIFQLGKVASSQGDQIRDVRFLLQVVHAFHAVRLFGFFYQATIGKDGELLGHVTNHLAGEPLVGIVDARKPMPGFMRFTLGPNMGVLVTSELI